MLGLEVDGEGERVTFARPLLPSWLDRVTLRRLPVGRALVDVALERTPQGMIKLKVLANPGRAKVELRES